MIECFDPHMPTDKVPKCLLTAVPLNYNSIARVCDTDAKTVEDIVKEIAAQIKYQLKCGSNLKLYLKIGKLCSKNGQIQWQSF